MKTDITVDEMEKIIGINSDLYPKIGILQWFHKNDYTHVENAIKDLKMLGIKEIRTGILWPDFLSKGGQEWYDWMIPKLSESLKLLPCLLFTPPSLGIASSPQSPLTDPEQYADFVEIIINRYGQFFDYIELWNEPNNLSNYNYLMDPSWEIYSRMIIQASSRAHLLGKKTVLGGMSPIDANWLENRAKENMLKAIDVIGIHGFPEVLDFNFKGWINEIDAVERVLFEHKSPAEIWITETGYSSWRNDDQNQVSAFLNVLKTPVKRIYWSSLYDLSPNHSSWKGFHFDEREYHFGMIKYNGLPKLLYRLLSNYQLKQLQAEPILKRTAKLNNLNRKKGILITGGAGFIGTNLAHRLLNEGKRVIIYDNLSRPGVENNLKWLVEEFPGLEIMIADVMDFHSLKRAVAEAEHIFHFAAQVAVTSSLQYPVHDYEVNAGGTIKVLEAIRQSKHKPSLVFTSTNKVYGDLSDLELKSDQLRYFPYDTENYKYGINEKYPLNFLSPYGNSKGCADQYVLDYARSFGLRDVVFRMSCIYGPHQFGTEDQGWIAHFLNQSIKNNNITIYGDGKQVRDVLYIDDLIEAFLLAMKNINEIKGEAFNIGGGPGNAISLMDLIAIMHKLDHLKIHVRHDSWRTGDQKYYVSDIRKFLSKTGWQPKISYQQGVAEIFKWLYEDHHAQKQKTMILK